MRKIAVSIIALLVSSMTLMAGRVSREDAALVANHFMSVAAPAADGVQRVAPAVRMVLKESSEQTESQYYVYENENMESVLRKFESTDAWNLPVVKEDRTYLGFVSKSKIFSAYRNELKELSQD